MISKSTLLIAFLSVGLMRCGAGVETPVAALEEESGRKASYALREGEALFSYYCATCHGDLGQGDGFNSYNLDPKPRDLPGDEFQLRVTDRDIAEVIRLGGGAAGMSTGMPSWGKTLSDRDIDYLVAFVRALPERQEDEEEGM